MKLKILYFFGAAFFLFALTFCSGGKGDVVVIERLDGKTDTIAAKPIFDIKTNKGTMRIQLYDDTPLHRNNFAKLALSGFYDSLLFHRVIQNMIIQTGDPESKGANAEKRLGAADIGYKVQAEIKEYHTNKFGAIGGVQTSNTSNSSSGSQFYIVQGHPDVKHLDGRYTIFGEVISGFSVIDTIGNAPLSKTNFNRPIDDIVIESIKYVKK